MFELRGEMNGADKITEKLYEHGTNLTKMITQKVNEYTRKSMVVSVITLTAGFTASCHF